MDEVSVSDPADDLLDATTTDPDIPAERYQASRLGIMKTREIEGNRSADVATPLVQTRTSLVAVPSQAEFGRIGQGGVFSSPDDRCTNQSAIGSPNR
jgi:hypothetical protein